MSHVIHKTTRPLCKQSLKKYRCEQMKEKRWKHVEQGVSEQDLNNNFDFLNNAVINRCANNELLMTTTGLYGPIRAGTVVHLDNKQSNLVVQSKEAPSGSDDDLITLLNKYHKASAGQPPSKEHALAINGYWTSAIDGAGIRGLDGGANVFGSTGQLICDADNLNFPLLKAKHKEYRETLKYYGAMLLAPHETFSLGFTQDLWGIQYDQKLPEYITDYQFGGDKGGGLFVEHHPFPHIWLPAKGKDPEFNKKTRSRVLLGRRLDSSTEDDYYRTVDTQQFHFTMFEIPNDGSALVIRPQCIHNDSFTEGAQTVFLANTAANTVALRHSMPITTMSAGGIPVAKIAK